MRRKIISRKGLSKKTKKIADENPNHLGIANDKLVEPIPTFIRAPCEKVFEGENNAWITLGRDRPGDLLSGYGGAGHTECGTIDIVAGRRSANVKEYDNSLFDEKQVFTHNNIREDASRIYISQKTDLDKNFHLSPVGKQETSSKAAVAIKSDNVALIARESIKFVTGVDSKNSRGAPQISIPGIYLVAGNDTDGLQAIPLGDNLVECIEKLVFHIDSLTAALDSFLTYQIEFNAEIQTHTHPDPISMFLGEMSSGNPLEITQGSVLQSPDLVIKGAKVNAALISATKADIVKIKTNLHNSKINYLKPYGARYIKSRHNKVN